MKNKDTMVMHYKAPKMTVKNVHVQMMDHVQNFTTINHNRLTSFVYNVQLAREAISATYVMMVGIYLVNPR